MSSVLVVQRDIRKIKLCVDLGNLNEATIVDNLPLSHTKRIFLTFASANYFSKLHPSSAYHQLVHAEKIRNLTAVITHEGVFRYTRVRFGLAAVATFQNILSMILKE